MNDVTESREQKIEKAIDKGVTSELAIYGAAGSSAIAPRNMSELMEFAKMVALGGVMIRPAFRNNPGACLALTMQAMRWGLDVFSVGSKAYIVKNRAGEEQIAWEAQLVHAVVNTRAPLKGRLQIKYEGEGPERRCIVSGTLKGETKPATYESPEVKAIAVQNSPLWKADVDQQLHYYSTRAWARRHVPEVIMGIYTPDEIEAQEAHYGPEHAIDVTPTGPRPSRHTLEKPEETAETYPLIDHIGEVESKAAYPEQWAKELLAASAPTVDGRFTDKSIGYLVNNAQAAETMYPLIKDDALVTELQARYAAAEEQRQETPQVPGGTGAVGDADGSPAAAAPAKEITQSATATPTAVADAAGGPSPQGSPAAPLVAQPVQEPPLPVAPEPPAPQPAPAAEKPVEGPKAIPMPISAKTKKPDSAAYLVAIQKEMTEAATQPEHIDMILTREGYLTPRKYAPGSNLAIIMNQTSGSIEMFALRRKQTLGQG